jgi:hypothetical protein
MRRILLTFATMLCFTAIFSQVPGQLSLIFSSEPQNAMASDIPKLLLEAYRQGDIRAYYPRSPNVPIPYAQFIQRYTGSAKAQEILKGNPSWFCEESELPRLSKATLSCLSEKFELGEKLEVNRVSMQNELKQYFIRLIHSEACDPRGFETYGPFFKMRDIETLTQKPYRMINPQNQAITYSIIDVMRLRLFSASTRKE